MQRFGISVELVEPMRPYLRALNWGTLPLLAYFALRRYLQAVNVAHPIMFALISANIVNAVRKLGSDLRAPWLSRHGHYRLRLVNLLGPYLYGALPCHHTFVVESKRLRPGWMGTIRIDVRQNVGVAKAGSPCGHPNPLRNRSFLRRNRIVRQARPGSFGWS